MRELQVREQQQDKLILWSERAEHTMTRCQLFSNNAIDGEECDVPKHFVIINHIISWPWRDKVKMVFYCCNVDGWFGHFGQEDWREAVLYHLYSVDIPRRMLAAFHESGSANTEVQQCHVAGITVSPKFYWWSFCEI